MDLIEGVELRTGDTNIRLKADARTPRWCQVSLRHGAKLHQLGADDRDVVVSRLLAAMEQPIAIDPEPRAVLALAEQHTTIYRQDDSLARHLVFRDAQGDILADVALPDRTRGEWIVALDKLLGPICDLRIDPADARLLPMHPPHVVHELRQCATWTVRHPSAVFRGLRGDGALRDGRVYCGLPPVAFDNGGRDHPRPEGMVYCVFVTQDGYVFDWDWVRAGEDVGEPENSTSRFGRREWVIPRARIVGVEGIVARRSELSRPFYSERGDCVFCYFGADMSYAQRATDDLTIFRRRSDDVPTGFKVKNVRRLVAELQQSRKVRQVDSTFEVKLTLLLEASGRAVAISDSANRTWKLVLKKCQNTFGASKLVVPLSLGP